jgi:GMP synthase (glutamine-hydrolysing)
MRILVIKNLGQLNHLIWRTIRDLDVDTELILNSTPLEEIKKKDPDALIIGGGPYSVHEDLDTFEKMGYCKDYILNFKGPILGICLGHQAIAHAMGGKVDRGSKGEYGFSEIEVDDSSSLLKGLDKFTAWVSHFDEVKELPQGFKSLAHSDVCKVEAMEGVVQRSMIPKVSGGVQGSGAPRYGLQFHPEAHHTEHGEEIFKNFIEIVKR